MIDSRIVIGLITVLITMAVLAYDGINEQDRMAAATETFHAKSIQNGAVIFEDACSECHGPEGQGVLGRAPALNTDHFFNDRLKEIEFSGTLEAYVALTVAGGRPVKSSSEYQEIMPTWGQEYGGPLRPDQVRDVVAFVLNWGGEEREAVDAAADAAVDDPFQRGLNLFNNSGCSACHIAGSYSSGTVGPDLTNTYADKGPDYILESIIDTNAVVVEGYPASVMPQNLGDLLSGEQIDDITEFLKGVSEGR